MRSTTPGGAHNIKNEWQDFTLAQHEGFATGLARLVEGSPVDGRAGIASYGLYIQGVDYRSAQLTPRGWFQESSFSAFIWRLFDPLGVIKLPAEKILAPFYSEAWRSGIWAASPWAYGAILKSQNPAFVDDIDFLATSLDINLAGNDSWGTKEVVIGSRSASQTFPIYTDVSVGKTARVCSVGEKAEYNKLSNRRYLRLSGDGTQKKVTVTGRAGTVPYLYVDRAAGSNGFFLEPGRSAASFLVTIPAGGAYGWIGDCAVTYWPSTSVVDKACSAQPYTPPAETCWDISVEN
jgi:hypothetical protein